MLRRYITLRRVFPLVAIVITALGRLGTAQTDTAKIFGFVVDHSGRYMANVTIELVDLDRGVRRRVKTNAAGFYVFSDVKPAAYRMQVSVIGFQTVSLPKLTVVVQDNISQTFMLSRGNPSNTTIQARGAPLNITGAVSTVVDTDLVANLPLNGRSFQTLFQLIPGVVIAPTTFASQGQFAVNGQRTDTNAFIVDGVSANFAIAAGVNPGQSAGGWLPALTAFGGTNGLVSTDAVQEFAVLTSSYSAEFGRVPGAQISIVTRSGTNGLGGNLFEYFRNDAMDANDWFANNKGLKRAALRQNDFGGVLGGPIKRDKTFFFASFEALQLRQPTSSSTAVPSLMARNSALAPVKPFLNAYPLPNGPDEGNGLAQATYGFSNPSSLEALSLRVDHHFHESLSTFVRVAYSISDGRQRAASSDAASAVTDTHFGLKTLTGGITYSFSPRLLNDFRFNWSQSSAGSKEALDSFGGAIPLGQQLVFPPGFNAETSLFQFVPAVTQEAPELELGRNVRNTQAQINLVDDLSYQAQSHLIKLGVDLRKVSPDVTPAAYEQQSLFPDIPSAQINTGLIAEIAASVPVRANFKNYSLFAEDTWTPSSRFTATLGIRWDYAPSPSVRGANGLQPFALTGFANLGQLSLAPPGTPLYHTSKNGLAPRIGFAYEVRHSAGSQSVLKAGAGIFYDLSNGPLGNTLSAFSFPFAARAFVSGASLPLSPGIASPPSITTNPPFSAIDAFPSSLGTPYSYIWNLSFHQAIGTAQTASVSYVGNVGHGLLWSEAYAGGEAGVPTSFTQILLTNNSGYSNFGSLQVKFDRRAGRAHVIASYSLSHSLDNVSTDVDFNGIPGRFVDPHKDYGPSDFDIRHSGVVGMDYSLPQVVMRPKVLKSLVSGWSIDPIVVCRSSPPANPEISRDIGFGLYDFRPDLTPSVPLYMANPGLPGGRMINTTALSVPETPRQGTLGRNFFRGFPLFQTDLAVRRSFRITESTHLETRVEAFNIFNHPNFASPSAQLGMIDAGGKFIPQAGFGISPAMLSGGLQGGSFGSGFSPLYQIGGSRSIQLAGKVEF